MNKLSENGKTSESKISKTLIRETSVYEYYMELKEDALTEQGFLDLKKVPDLRISGTGQFLKNLRIKKTLRQKDIAKILGVSRSQINHWENNYRKMDLQSLVKIAIVNGVSKDTIYSFIDQGKFNTKVNLPAKLEKIRDILKYLSPQKSSIHWLITLTENSEEILSKIISTLNVKPISLCYSKVIYSKELYNYLTTFFRYTKVPKIQPPLTKEVKLLYKNGIDLKRAIICPSLQSDGNINKRNHSLRFCGKNKILHDYFVDAMYYEYNIFPSSYFKCWDKRRGNCYETCYVERPEIVDEVMKLAGNSKTKPAQGQKVEEYLKEPQPHLNYLTNASETEKKIALRIWASAEGYISIYKYAGHFYPKIGIGCAHPDLATQLQKILQHFNINFIISRVESYWSGIRGLLTTSPRSCIGFLKLGGFIKDIKIGEHSKYHKGIHKDILTLGILELKKRENTDWRLRYLSLKGMHEEVNTIIKKREYNTADYYIDYFS
jgi:transcriptional regulator with XRE-family HTH domain